MNRSANKGYEFNVQKDLLPLYSGANSMTLTSLIAKEAGVNEEDIIDSDLFLYNRQKGCTYGASNEYLLSPQLAMHSICETCGTEDTADLIKLAAVLFGTVLTKDGDCWLL